MKQAWMVSPRLHRLPILGLGYSAPTPRHGITAPILVVDSFEELHENRHKAIGKIVVFNQKFVSYDVTSKYRKRGPEEAAKAGAVAVLVRSVTPFSIATPHTGVVAPNSKDLTWDRQGRKPLRPRTSEHIDNGWSVLALSDLSRSGSAPDTTVT
ncbi:hypothetical protein MTO96_035673 [Rhipicephalus appendiculatus]